MKRNMTTGKKWMVLFAGVLFTGALAVVPAAMAKDGGFKGPHAGGGYTGPGPVVMTMQKAAEQPDDTWVTLEGKILNHKGDEKYTFQDASGSGVVEIDRKAWRGVEVGPSDTVQLLVEVDKDWGAVEFEAKSIKVIAK